MVIPHSWCGMRPPCFDSAVLNVVRKTSQERCRQCALSSLPQVLVISVFFLTDLKTILMEKMQREIPVITVVPVMGTTEEGAVDPLTEILALKDKLRKQVSWRLLKSITFFFVNSIQKAQIKTNINGTGG